MEPRKRVRYINCNISFISPGTHPSTCSMGRADHIERGSIFPERHKSSIDQKGSVLFDVCSILRNDYDYFL